MILKFYRLLFLLSPWAIVAGMVQFHFQSFLPAQRFFHGLEFFDFVTVTDLFVGLLVLIFLIGWKKGQIRGVAGRVVPSALRWAIILLLVAAGLQFLFQQVYEPVLSTPSEYFRSLFIFPLIFGVLAYQTLDTVQLKRLLNSYFLMVATFCVMALIQHFFGIFPGEQKDFMGRLVWPYIDFLTLESSSANWTAFFVTPTVILSFVHLVRTRRWQYGALLLLSVATLYLTQSYGGYIAVLVAVTLYLFRALPLKKFLVAMIGLVALAGGVFLHQQTTWKYSVLTGQAEYRFATSVTSRSDIYRMNLHMIQTYPLLGTGLNQYQSYFAANQLEVLGGELNESHVPPHAHNFFMSFWTSLGLFGFVAMLFLVLGIFWRTKLDSAYPAVFVVVAIMVHGLIDSYYWKQEIAYFFWLMVVLAYLYRFPVHDKK